MVIRANHSTHATSRITTRLATERTYYWKSIILDPLIIDEVESSPFMVLVLPLYTTLLTVLGTAIGTLPHVRILSATYVGMLYTAVLLYTLLAAVVFRWYVRKQSVGLLSFMHAINYTLTYVPAAVMVRLVMRDLGFIFVLACVMVVQYYTNMILTAGMEWTGNERSMFVLSLIVLVMSFVFVYGIEHIVVIGIMEGMM